MKKFILENLVIESICVILSIAFMNLKLCDVINWHWVIVFLPIIISVGLNILLIIIAIIVKIISEI